MNKKTFLTTGALSGIGKSGRVVFPKERQECCCKDAFTRTSNYTVR